MSFDQKQLRASFNAVAMTYAGAAVMQRDVGEELISRLDYIKLNPSLVLDLGAGPGMLTQALSRQYPKAHVMAIDWAESMLHEVNKKRKWRSRIRGVCADMHTLPLPDNSVDLIFSNLALHWTQDWSQIFKELYRVLSPEGLLMFSTMGPDTLKELRASWQVVDNQVHVNTFSDMHDIGDCLLHTSFSDPVMDMEMLAVHYPDVISIMRDLKALGVRNLNHARPQGLTGKSAFGQVLAAYEDFKTDEGYPASYEVVYGQAWKPMPQPTRKMDADGVVQVPLSGIGRR